MTRAEALWLKIIGALLILLGMALFASPTVTYTTREKVVNIGSLDVTAKRRQAVVIPRPVSVLTMGVGFIVLVIAKRKPQE
jgi:hypothetical protein